jgi:hypothetical protein
MSAFFNSLFAGASEVALEAAAKAVPTPMTVVESDLLTGAPSGRSYYVSEGLCGFAWVKIKGNTPFGRWAKKMGYARPAYGGGLMIYCPLNTQSYDRKTAWATAFAKVLTDAGIFAYCDSRLD